MVVEFSIVMVVMSVMAQETTTLMDISKEIALPKLKSLSKINTEMTGTSIVINVILYGGFILHAVYYYKIVFYVQILSFIMFCTTHKH